MKPSILFVTVDDLRFDAIFPAPDSSEPRYEAFQRLADEGVTCTRTFSNASESGRSFRGIFSGTHHWRYGGDRQVYEAERPHLAAKLQELGYTTVGFHSNPFLNPQYGYDCGFDSYNNTVLGSQESNSFSPGERVVKWATNRITASERLHGWATKTISAIGASTGIDPRGKPYQDASDVVDKAGEVLPALDEPYFLWTHFMDVHSPWYPHDGTESEDMSRREAIRAFHRYRQDSEDVDREILTRLRRLYQGEVEYFTTHLDRLLDLVQDESREVVVALVADHGEAFGEHGVYRHPWDLYNELVHVPCFYSGVGAEGVTVATASSTLDVYPTLVRAAGGNPRCDGLPIQEQLDQETHERRVYAGGGPPDRGWAMVASAEYKYIYDLKTGEEELYRISEDYREQKNLVEQEYRVKEDYASSLEEWYNDLDLQGERSSRAIEVSPEVQRRLQHLGYSEEEKTSTIDE